LRPPPLKLKVFLASPIFFSVFPYPAIPEVGTGKPALVGGFLDSNKEVNLQIHVEET
jgi:hypothetical protein